MTYLFIGITFGWIGSFIFNNHTFQKERNRLWNHITILEGDKRALTESLCRAQGKPYIQPREQKELIPSEGWFDGATTIKVNPS